MQRLAQTAEAVAATTKKTEKVQIVAAYLRSLPCDEAAVAAIFLSGRAFPAYEATTLQVGGTMLWRAVVESSGATETMLTQAYRRHGDLGAATHDVLVSRLALEKAERSGLGNLLEIAESFRALAHARGVASKKTIVTALLSRATPLEAKYLVKIITGELRIGLKESLVEEAIAAAFGAPVTQVQRANMMLGDIGESLRLVSDGKLDQARMRLLHPLGFMLASPAETADEAFEYFGNAAVEDKYDGIRAQAHVSGRDVRLFSRTLDDITAAFPELVDPLAAFPDGLVLDGEILAWDFAHARALPFSDLQKRLGRKVVSRTMLSDVPVAYVVFDILYARGDLTIDWPLRERAALLDSIFAEAARNPRTHASGARLQAMDAQGTLQFEPAVVDEEHLTRPPSIVLRAPVTTAHSPAHLDELFSKAQARGNEGLMIKDLDSPYAPGRRGKSWLKLKRELATLDVVVTSVEWGHGKRSGVLSDYTFAVRTGDELLNIGKAYSGLTDREIADMTEWFLAHTVEDQGYSRIVEPQIVVEVAFNAIMRSDRHNSGYALRFPRILRLRPDKRPDEIDTIDAVDEIFARQHPLKKTA